MVKNKGSFEDELVILAKISSLIEESNILPKNGLKFEIPTDKEIYYNILSNFRDIDKKNESFSIDMENIEFKFSLKK